MSTTSYPATELGAGASTASRAAILLYGIATYLFFLAVFVYTIGFVGGFVVPKHIENGLLVDPSSAILVDVALLALFAIQHSVMARPAFKRWWTQVIPPAAERSTFVLCASALLIEEATLVETHGELYDGYRRRVPALLPRFRSWT